MTLCLRSVHDNVGRVPHLSCAFWLSLVLPGVYASHMAMIASKLNRKEIIFDKDLPQVTLILLMLLRYTTYKAINNHFFMLDFCYFMQVSVITQALLFPPTSSFGAAWFKANFALRSDLVLSVLFVPQSPLCSLSHGPIAIAILAWQNSMVFHSLDKMTSFYIHIMPPLTCYMQVADIFKILKC